MIINIIKQRLYDTWLCIKYPFLYPRNRFDGKHHNRFLSKYYNNYIKKSIAHVNVHLQEIKDDRTLRLNTSTIWTNVHITDKKLYVTYNNQEYICKDLTNNLRDKFSVYGIEVDDRGKYKSMITVYVKTIDSNDTTNYGFCWHTYDIVMNKRYKRYADIIDYIDTKILDNIWKIPSYTELDALERGWRTAFGIQLCKDLKNSILHAYTQDVSKYNIFKYVQAYIKGLKSLYSFRVLQIKEKYGYLHFYYTILFEYEYNIIYNVIRKYEDISRATCISCGKPATYITTGYICPYCDCCVPKTVYKCKIEEYYGDRSNESAEKY